MSEMTIEQGPAGPVTILPPEAQAREAEVRERFWPKLRRVAGRLPFAEDVVAVYFCAFDRKTPLRARMILLGALAYFLMPADTIPDMLPLLGFTDDASVIAAAIGTIGVYLSDEHRQAARRALDRGAG
jgi:uncharacterized membrane protein YkvA (DUF1232 family)